MSFIDLLIQETKKDFEDSRMKAIQIGKKVIMSPVPCRDKLEDYPYRRRGITYKSSFGDIIINDVDLLEQLFKSYVVEIQKAWGNNSDTSPERLLDSFWWNATNSDFANPEEYMRRYIAFYKDKTFEEYKNHEGIQLGTMGEDNIISNTWRTGTGHTAPYAMEFFVKNPSEEGCFVLPLILYGIEGTESKKTAYIYRTQTLGKPLRSEYGERIDKTIKQINRGNSKFRNVSPSSLFTLSIFIGMLQKEGISDIKCADLVFRKWMSGWGMNDEEQSRQTDKFLMNFARLNEHFENFHITAVPNDIDSFLHMNIEEDSICDRALLEQAYLMGFGKIKTSPLGLSTYQKEVSDDYTR